MRSFRLTVKPHPLLVHSTIWAGQLGLWCLWRNNYHYNPNSVLAGLNSQWLWSWGWSYPTSISPSSPVQLQTDLCSLHFTFKDKTLRLHDLSSNICKKQFFLLQSASLRKSLTCKKIANCGQSRFKINNPGFSSGSARQKRRRVILFFIIFYK